MPNMKYDENTWTWKQQFSLYLNHFDQYVLITELEKTIEHTKFLRDQAGINENDIETEPNKHIKILKDIINQINLQIEDKKD